MTPLESLIAADVPALLWGRPGIGKTATISAMASARGAHLEVLIGSVVDPVDVGGYLIPTPTGVRCEAPPWAQRMRAALDKGREAWLFLDELSCAPPAVLSALLRVVMDRAVAEIDLKGCRILAAANPSDTAEAEGQIGPALANRFGHLEWAFDLDRWITGTLTGWGKPYKDKALAASAATVADYLRRHPTAVQSDPGDRGWASPRSWTHLIRARAHGGDDPVMIAALVGQASASAFLTWTATRDLPDPEEVLKARRLPGSKLRGDQVAAILGAVTAAALMDLPDRDERVRAAWAVVGTARPDVSITAARALIDGYGEIPTEAVALAEKITAASR